MQGCFTWRNGNLDGINSVNTKCTNDYSDVDKELRTFLKLYIYIYFIYMLKYI